MLSPKQIGTICLVFSFVFLSQSSYSENIPSENPTCDNSTLGVYSGSAALEPDWGANKIPLRWYNNNTLITDVTSAESECTYDGSIDVATAPTRTGFTFKGWRVSPQMDFSTLNSLGNPVMGYGKGLIDEREYCGHNIDGTWYEGFGLCQENVKYHDLSPNEWKAEFSTGTVYGMSKCSATTGTFAVADTPSDDGTANTKIYCWCKATGWEANGSVSKSVPLEPLSWVFINDHNNARHCSYACALHCSFYVSRGNNYANFRTALFTPATTNQ